jgi:hypothetical protein
MTPEEFAHETTTGRYWDCEKIEHATDITGESACLTSLQKHLSVLWAGAFRENKPQI